MERGIPIAVPGIDLSPRGKQNYHDGKVPESTREVEGCVTDLAFGVHPAIAKGKARYARSFSG